MLTARSIAAAARQAEVGQSTLRRWLREDDKKAQRQNQPAGGNPRPVPARSQPRNGAARVSKRFPLVRDQPVLGTSTSQNPSRQERIFRDLLKSSQYADGSEELYDMKADPNEWKNLAGDASYRQVRREHRRWIPKVNAKPGKPGKPGQPQFWEEFGEFGKVGQSDAIPNTP